MTESAQSSTTPKTKSEIRPINLVGETLPDSWIAITTRDGLLFLNMLPRKFQICAIADENVLFLWVLNSCTDYAFFGGNFPVQYCWNSRV